MKNTFTLTTVSIPFAGIDYRFVQITLKDRKIRKGSGELALSKINVYPNQSIGLVGIKFADISTGKFLTEIFTTQGQTVLRKEFVVFGKDVMSHLSCVNQLLIK